MSRVGPRTLWALWPFVVACGAAELDERQLTLEGPAHVKVTRLGPVEAPAVALSDGSAPDRLVWAAQPESVAIVAGSNVEAVGPGTAVVTGTWRGQMVTWTLEVHPAVVLQFVDPPERITVGQRVPLKLIGRIGDETIDPGEVAWETSNDDVLAVAPGQATAIHAGTAYVTAESKLGSRATLQLQVIETAAFE